MDLRGFFKKVKEVERKIAEKEAYVMSLATPDGGLEGVITLVARRTAAQLVVDGKARLASEVEVAAFVAAELVKRLAHQRQVAARQVQVHLVSDPAALLKTDPAKE